MIFPYCRVRFKPILTYKSKKNAINGYWEGYLNDDYKQFLRGYDSAVEDTLDSFFASICDCEFLEEIFNHHEIEEIEKSESAFNLEFELPDDAPKSVRFVRGLYEELRREFENERNEMIVTFIENMDDDEYKAIRKEKDKGLPEEIRNLEYNQI